MSLTTRLEGLLVTPTLVPDNCISETYSTHVSFGALPQACVSETYCGEPELSGGALHRFFLVF